VRGIQRAALRAGSGAALERQGFEAPLPGHDRSLIVQDYGMALLDYWHLSGQFKCVT
jgi:hypothetical protein